MPEAGSCRGSDAEHMRPSSQKSSIEHLCRWRGRWWSSWQPSELSAPGQPPDLQGVQIDARRRNNRRIGNRGSAEGDLMERILPPLSPLASDVPLPPFVTESVFPPSRPPPLVRSLSPSRFFLSRDCKRFIAEVSVAWLLHYDEMERRVGPRETANGSVASVQCDTASLILPARAIHVGLKARAMTHTRARMTRLHSQLKLKMQSAGYYFPTRTRILCNMI